MQSRHQTLPISHRRGHATARLSGRNTLNTLAFFGLRLSRRATMAKENELPPTPPFPCLGGTMGPADAKSAGPF
jgi:hypothetical protein